ncbi:keratin, type I cytoskeletal 9-like isoform X2 [Belonocnema kinseyi]|nr:keratin, type I cytoskeletal 9-like isoform X2 [Belonocnema kinseyi]
MKVYRRHRLNKDKRGAADYPMTSYASPSYSQTGSSLSHSGYSLRPGIQSFAGFGGFGGYGGSVGHGLQFSDSSSSAAGLGYNLGISSGGGHGLSLGSGSGNGLSLGSGVGHALSLGGLSLGEQSGHLIPIQSKTGPVTFGSNGGGAGGGGGSSSNSGYSSSPHYSGLQSISAFGGAQSGGHNLPLVLGSSQGSSYKFPGSSGITGSHGLSLASLGSGGSPTYSLPFSGAGQHGSGGYLISAASHGSSKYSIPISSGSSGYTLSSSGSPHAAATYFSPVSSAYNQANAQEASGGSRYAQPISSYSGSDSKSSPYTKYIPASSDGSTYATSDSSNSSPVSSYSSQGTSYSSPSLTYAGSGQTELAGSPSYAGLSGSNHASSSTSQSTGSFKHAGTSYSTPSASYSSANYQSPASSYSSPAVQYADSGSSYLGLGGYAPQSSPQAESAGAYSSLSARYRRHPTTKAVDNKESDLSMYDTISYSAPIEFGSN